MCPIIDAGMIPARLDAATSVAGSKSDGILLLVTLDDGVVEELLLPNIATILLTII